VTRRRSLKDLDDDIREHLEREIQDHIDRGLSPEDARAEALKAFGSVARVKEDARAVWIPLWIDQLWQDNRYALRMLRRSPGFSAVVVLTLAIGIGLNTAVFSVVDAVLMRPPAFAHPERVVWLTTLDPRIKDEFVTSHDFQAWREAKSLERLVAYDEFDGRITAAGTSAPARVATVSDDFWEMAAARPALGRLPASGQSEVLLSHAFFERWFGGNPDVVGKPAMVAGRQTTIAGVLPAGFRADLVPPPSVANVGNGAIDVYRAIVVRPLPNGMIQLFRVVGELKPGISIETARAEIETIRARWKQANPGVPFRPTLQVVPLMEKLVGGARAALMILLAAVALVLLVGCANIASLFLARASARQKEIAIRTALGAGRGRMVRQFLVESLILALAGGSAGLLIARGSLQMMVRLIPQAVPRLTEAALDGRVLAFALCVSALTALMFGVGPAFTFWNANPNDALKGGSRAVSPAAGRLRTRTSLVTAELALTLVLLCGAGLLVKSLWRITARPAGFDPAHTLTVTVQYDTGGQQGSEERRRAFISDVLGRIRPTAGVEAVGMSTNAGGRMRLVIEGRPESPMQDRPTALHSSVSADYAKAIGMGVVAGRWVNDAERDPVFVLNESLARGAFPGEDPIGKRIQTGGPGAGATFGTIVGVVADLKYTKLDASPEPEIFADYAHASPFTINFVVRTSGNPLAIAPTIRALVDSVDKAQTITDTRTVEAALSESIAPRRFTVFLLGIFAATALLLALIGIYGVIAYSVAQRTQEIGVRMALGAERRAVVVMVVRQGMSMAIAGLVLGVAAALALTRVMTGLLYEVTPTDPATFAAVVGVLAATALAACCGPAFKAARVDPLVALRHE
jgi:putative ABC transport system permease protein